MHNTLLLDIEGTICPISFVKDTLFPYFTSQIPKLLQLRQSDSTIDELLNKFQIASDNELISHIENLVARDVKDPILKQLQGYIWQFGYQTGEIKAPIYSDSVELIKNYPNVYIYSSGSVKAQKLLFQYVQDPQDKDKIIDLRPYILNYFDITTSGPKVESKSYENILQTINKKPEEVLFLSDNPKELDAAKIVGLEIGLAIREGNAKVENENDYTTYYTFEKLNV